MQLHRICVIVLSLAAVVVGFSAVAHHGIREIRASYWLPASGVKLEFSWEAGRGHADSRGGLVQRCSISSM